MAGPFISERPTDGETNSLIGVVLSICGNVKLEQGKKKIAAQFVHDRRILDTYFVCIEYSKIGSKSKNHTVSFPSYIYLDCSIQA